MYTTIYMTEKNNQLRHVCECGIAYVCIGNTYRVYTKKAVGLFTNVTEDDISRMKRFIEFYS